MHKGRCCVLVVGNLRLKAEDSLVVHGPTLEKLKPLVTDFHKIDNEDCFHAEERFLNALFN